MAGLFHNGLWESQKGSPGLWGRGPWSRALSVLTELLYTIPSTTVGSLEIAREGDAPTTITFTGANAVSVTKVVSGWGSVSFDLSLDGLTAPVVMSIPNTLENAWSLVFGGNNAEGVYPNMAGKPGVSSININYNNLTGSIWPLSDTPNIAYLSISNNNLTGSFPSLDGITGLISVGMGDNLLSGPIPDFSNNLGLQNVYSYGNGFTGDVPAISTLTNLTAFSFGDNQLTGNIPDLSNNIALTEFALSGNSITGWAGGTLPASLTYFEMSWTPLPQATVDALLAAFVAAGAVNGHAGFNGTGGASAAGLLDRDTLVGRGWTVTLPA